MPEETLRPEQIIRATAFCWKDGKLYGNWGLDEMGHVSGLSESDVRSTIRTWIRMLRNTMGTDEVDEFLEQLQNRNP